MSRFRDWKLECKVYVGELGSRTSKQDLEELFNRYGPLKNVWVARNPPGFAFIEFEDEMDAEDACKALDGTRLNNRQIRVEMSSGKQRRRGGRRGGGPRFGGDRHGGGGDRYGGGGDRYGGSGRRDYGRHRSRIYSSTIT